MGTLCVIGILKSATAVSDRARPRESESLKTALTIVRDIQQSDALALVSG